MIESSSWREISITWITKVEAAVPCKNTCTHTDSDRLETSRGSLTSVWLLRKAMCFSTLVCFLVVWSRIYCDSPWVMGWSSLSSRIHGNSHRFFMCGRLGSMGDFSCGGGRHLFTVGKCVDLWDYTVFKSHVYNFCLCVSVRFQPGSLKPTRMWPRWVSSRPRCASSRRGSPCPSLESRISLPSKYLFLFLSPSPVCLGWMWLAQLFNPHAFISRWTSLFSSAGSTV